MKKSTLTVAALMLCLSLAGCSSSGSAETTAAAQAEEETAQTEAEKAGEAEVSGDEEEEDDIEEDYATGTIIAMDGDIVTVMLDEDASERNYDISGAEKIMDFPIGPGDEVEITFPYENAEDPVPAMVIEVLDSASADGSDPTVAGRVTEVNEDVLVLNVDGEDYPMGVANAYIVGADGIVVGREAHVTFLGDLDDEPMAVRVVMEDAYGTDEALISAFLGPVVEFDEDEGSSIVIESAGGDFFTFISDDIDFSDYDIGDLVIIEYEGSIAEKAVQAVSIRMQ